MSGRLKSLKLNTLYIFLIFSCAAALVVGGLVGVTYAELLDVEYHPSEQEVSDIACFRQFSGCCCCDVRIYICYFYFFILIISI